MSDSVLEHLKDELDLIKEKLKSSPDVSGYALIIISSDGSFTYGADTKRPIELAGVLAYVKDGLFRKAAGYENESVPH